MDSELKKQNRQHLHELLDQACDQCRECEFVASHFVSLCLQELTYTNLRTVNKLQAMEYEYETVRKWLEQISNSPN